MPRLLVLVILVATPAVGGIDCTCRFEGRDMPEGSVVCIDLPSGTYLARCERVLNNTAWKRLRDGCVIG